MLSNEICPSCSFNILIIVQPAAEEVENPNPSPSNSFPINNSHPNSRVKNTTIDIATTNHHLIALKLFLPPVPIPRATWQRNIRPLSMILPSVRVSTTTPGNKSNA